MQDRRIAKTQKAIQETFLDLLREKKLSKITVSELSRRADLGRGTFYLHYQDVYDLYDCIENQLIHEFGEIYDTAYPKDDPANLSALTDMITQYIEHKRNLFLLLVRPEDNGKTLRKIKTFFKEKVLSENLLQTISPYDIAETTFIVSGVSGVIEDWLADGMIRSREEISSSLHNILLKFDTTI